MGRKRKALVVLTEPSHTCWRNWTARPTAKVAYFWKKLKSCFFHCKVTIHLRLLMCPYIYISVPPPPRLLLLLPLHVREWHPRWFSYTSVYEKENQLSTSARFIGKQPRNTRRLSSPLTLRARSESLNKDLPFSHFRVSQMNVQKRDGGSVSRYFVMTFVFLQETITLFREGFTFVREDITLFCHRERLTVTQFRDNFHVIS